MNDDCVRARGWLAQWADGELAARQANWIEGHWEECAGCRGERERFRGLDECLLCFGAGIEVPAETTMDRVRFLARIDQAESGRRKRLAFFPATAALLAAAAILVVLLPRSSPRSGAGENGFVPVPYIAPLTSYERSSVVSMQIPVSELLADGYGIAADPSSVVPADVLLGEDGRVQAVRLAANQLLKGAGE
jgi:putative zinc finger protein